MGGAVAMSAVGNYYQISDKDEPDVTIVQYLDNFHICLRKRSEMGKLKEIVADTRDRVLANMIAAQLQLLSETSYIQHEKRQAAPQPRNGFRKIKR